MTFINGIKEFPYEGTFYRGMVDDSLPLNRQEESRYVVLKTSCDVQEASRQRGSNTVTITWEVFVPKHNSYVAVGDTFECSVNGVWVYGSVVGVFPCQLGCKIYIG